MSWADIPRCAFMKTSTTPTTTTGDRHRSRERAKNTLSLSPPFGFGHDNHHREDMLHIEVRPGDRSSPLLPVCYFLIEDEMITHTHTRSDFHRQLSPARKLSFLN